MAMVRKGKCKRCGQCCEWLHLLTTEKPKIDFEFVGVRGLVSVDRPEGRCSLYAENRCPNLTTDYVCELQGLRPASCLAFPERPDDLLPGCGYYFEEE